MKHFIIHISFLLIVVFSLPDHALLAQEAPLIELNTVISDSITNGEKRWAFLGANNGVYSVWVEPTDSNLDPIVRIEDARGRVLLENDDYDYPNSRGALLEAFTINNAGTYYLVIDSFNNTQGDFNVTLYQGYSIISSFENFNANSDWQVFIQPEGNPRTNDDTTTDIDETSDNTDGDEDNAPIAETSNEGGQITLSLEGIQTELALRGGYAYEGDYYAHVDIQGTQGRNGWQVGILFGIEDADNFYAYFIDHRGFWRVIQRQDGADRILRDWSTHPAIIVGETDFRLAVMAYANTVELFYNDNYINNVSMLSTPQGDIGIMARTVNSLDSQTQFAFDDVVVKQPRSQQQPTMITSASGNSAIRQLQRQQLIDTGGLLLLNLDETSIRDNEIGISRFPIASGDLFTDFALGAEIDWQIDNNVLGGCGFVVHDAIEQDAYNVIFIDNQNSYTLAERDGDEYYNTIFQTDETLGSPPHDILIISRDQALHIYINQVYRGTLRPEQQQGGLGTAIVNYEDSPASCIYRNLWLWKPDSN
jgi:hypothetical protein